VRTIIVAAIGILPALASGQSAEPVATYRAVYEVEYKGKPLGTSEFSVSHDAARDVYVFESRTIAKGMLKLVSPNPVIEHSEFRVVNGALEPLEFRYEDGSRKGEDNFTIAFDWQSKVATTNGENGRREVALTAGVLDRGALQVALMRDLAARGQPGSYSVADDDGVQAYEYVPSGEESIATGIGNLRALKLTQQREGSSRMTLLWAAPELGHLPVRIEQRRDGEVQTAFTLQSVDGLAARE
jgi:Protein of unknown function (DUF3108)